MVSGLHGAAWVALVARAGSGDQVCGGCDTLATVRGDSNDRDCATVKLNSPLYSNYFHKYSSFNSCIFCL